MFFTTRIVDWSMREAVVLLYAGLLVMVLILGAAIPVLVA